MTESSRLPVLGPDGFEERLRDMGSVVVCFAADWCGFCARFLPEFARRAARGQAGVQFAVADVSDYDDPRWEAYAIRVVPTLVHFVAGAPARRLDGRLGYGLSAGETDSFMRGASLAGGGQA